MRVAVDEYTLDETLVDAVGGAETTCVSSGVCYSGHHRAARVSALMFIGGQVGRRSPQSLLHVYKIASYTAWVLSSNCQAASTT
jgi:hypothetical protein